LKLFEYWNNKWKFPIKFIIFFTTNCRLWGRVVSKLDCCSRVKEFKSQSRQSLFSIQMNVIIARKTICSITCKIRYFSPDKKYPSTYNLCYFILLARVIFTIYKYRNFFLKSHIFLQQCLFYNHETNYEKHFFPNLWCHMLSIWAKVEHLYDLVTPFNWFRIIIPEGGLFFQGSYLKWIELKTWNLFQKNWSIILISDIKLDLKTISIN